MRITHVAVAVIVWMKSVDLCWLDPTAAFASFLFLLHLNNQKALLL